MPEIEDEKRSRRLKSKLAFRTRHRERIRAWDRAQYAAAPQKFRDRSKAWRAAHLEAERARARAYRNRARRRRQAA